MIVAVDGPSGAGKSTVCREVARRLGFQLLDTGAIYRVVAWRAQQSGVSLDDGAALGVLASGLDVSFAPGVDEQRVLADGVDVTAAIRRGEMSQAASRVSAHPQVRDALLELQRRIGRQRDSVVEGRDIGTVVFPDAALKVFYVASVEVRAERRVVELQRRGEVATYDEVLADITARDERDRTRSVAPLRQADDAVLLDTSTMDFEQACAALLGLVDAARSASEAGEQSVQNG